MRRTRGQPAAWLRVGRVVLAGLMLAGCATKPEPIDAGRGVVTVQPEFSEEAKREMAQRSNPVRWLVRRIAVRQDTPVASAWAIADEDVLPAISRAVWNGNGLRLGRLSAGDADDFGQALGKPVELRDTQLVSFGYLDVLRQSPPLAATFAADLTVPPGPVYQETFTGGRLRLLIKSRPLGNGTARLTLTPQHYRPRVSLLPRTPVEKILDGRVYDELSVQVDVRTNQALLLGLYRPADPEPPTQTPTPPQVEDASTAASTTEPVEPQDREGNDPDTTSPEDEDLTITFTEPPQPRGPLTMGQGLFTTGLKDHDLQLLFLLRPLP
jgi:hypothetical protein